MKNARIARAAVLATALTIVGMLFAGSATAAPFARVINKDAGSLALDGTDIYWSVEKEVRQGEYETTLYRGSFLNKSKVAIAKFGGTTGDYINGLSAGGGYAAITLRNGLVKSKNRSGFTETSRVVRISRDGTRRDVLATGSVEVDGLNNYSFKNGVLVQKDCGTRVEALDVSSSGSVVLGRAVSERGSARCGKKKDVDRWRYMEARLDGTEREIFSIDRKVFVKVKKTKKGTRTRTNSGESAISNVDVVGDRVLFRNKSSESFFVRDLATGLLSGPFRFGATRALNYASATMSAGGAIALTSFYFAQKKYPTARNGIFPDFTNPSNVKLTPKLNSPVFCGRHLIAKYEDDSRVAELDPVTLAPIRVIAKPKYAVISFGLDIACTDDYLYAVDLGADPEADYADLEFRLLAYPLN